MEEPRMSTIDLALISTGSLGNAEVIGMSGDGRYVLIQDSQDSGTGSVQARLALVDAQTGAYQTIFAQTARDFPFVSPVISGDGHYVAYLDIYTDGAERLGRLQVWDRTTGATKTLLGGVYEDVSATDVAFSQDGRFLA